MHPICSGESMCLAKSCWNLTVRITFVSNYCSGTHHSEWTPFTWNWSCKPFTAGHQQHQRKRYEEKSCQLIRFHFHNLALLSFMAESVLREEHTRMSCNEAWRLYILYNYPRNSVLEDKFVI